ncbi:MAG: glycogen synthase [Candidatus Marinimicrobia bacterium]|nr:glycogen synthase [Candidatus Neomarinimicrobiota bacterium]
MKKTLNILFATAEVTPFSKAGGLADVAGALPAALTKMDCNVTIITPLYASVDRIKYNLFTPEYSDHLQLGDEKYSFAFYRYKEEYVTTIFVANDYFYSRTGIYTTSDGEGYSDNNARYFFFQKAILAGIEKQLLTPDLLHVNDHHTSLLPWMLKNRKLKIPTLLTIHNSMYQGQFSEDDAQLLDTIDSDSLELNSLNKNSLDIGSQFSDAVNTVSKTYRDELVNIQKLSYGLHGTIQKIQNRFSGILNGADYEYWNPEKDEFIAEKYSVDSISKKQKNKHRLLEVIGLPLDIDKPLFGSISRQVESKGFFLILDIMEELIQLDCRFVFLGTGDVRIMGKLKSMAEKYPNHVAVVQEYNEPLAHQIEAGADMFLMPSEYEPCGLNQIYSLKYGTIPIVRKTGGLADTVIDWDGHSGNGFVFNEYNSTELLNGIKRALAVYSTKSWNTVIQNAMAADFSWDQSAKQYKYLYNTIITGGIHESA